MFTVEEVIKILDNTEIFDEAVAEGVADLNNRIAPVFVSILIENYRTRLAEAFGLTEGEALLVTPEENETVAKVWCE